MRGDSDVGGTVASLVFLAILGLVAYGGYALWRDNYAAPDDKCYWLVKGDAYDFLVDVPPKSCAEGEWVNQHKVNFGRPDGLADFAQKAGRRICGQSVSFCAKP